MRILGLLLALVVVGALATVILRSDPRTRALPTLAATSSSNVSNPARAIVIGIDLSGTAPMVRDDAFAAKVASRIAPMISGLAPHSRVILRSFGSYNAQANAPLTLDVVIAPKTARADDIALLISNVVAGVPKMVRQGRIQAQPDTNIVPFLFNIANIVDCRAMPTLVVLASDGVEDSQIADLRYRRETLPPPPSAMFSGCDELLILGLGRGAVNSPDDTERLREEWTNWARLAGFQRFTGLNDW